MAKNTAKEDLLGTLHAAVAEHFTELLNSGEEISAAQMGNILRFLKDNDIVADKEVAGAIEEIREKLAANRKSIGLPDAIKSKEILDGLPN